MVVDRINWPLEDDSDEDEDFSLEEKCRTIGFLRMFIGNCMWQDASLTTVQLQLLLSKKLIWHDVYVAEKLMFVL